MKKFYITTPIYYPSGSIHLGHTYTSVAADVVARLKRAQGFDVMFLTGSDEHGLKIETNAKKESKTPLEYLNPIIENFKTVWNVLDITYDKFIRTTDDYHERAVQRIFKKLFDKGEIYKDKYEGWYCVPCEAFWTDSQLKDKKCPDCNRDVNWTHEEAYFFRLSKYQDKLLKHYEENPEFIMPESRRNEMLQFIKSGLSDLCVSRTSFNWGIPVDFDEKHIIYVWIDALSNYITALGYESENDENFKKYWPADIHFMAKEIIRFHAIIWPAILMALEIPLPKQIFGHGWLLFGDSGEKMSKSRGNVIDPIILSERYTADAMRYFLMREFPFGVDGHFSNEALINRINYDLANDLGNLLSRTTRMAEKYFAGTLPKIEFKAENLDNEIINMAKNLAKKFEEKMDKYQFSVALSEVWALISKCNKYIDETAPWTLGKDENNNPRLAQIIYNLCESLRIISILISPFMPHTAKKIQEQLGADENVCTWESVYNWGLLSKNAKITKMEVLFPRLDKVKELSDLENLGNKPQRKAENVIDLIGIEDFMKVKLIAAKVVNCEPIKKSNKLLKLTLNDGSGERIVASGIANYYKPEDLIDKTVVLVSNLKSAKLCGVESNGMILAATCGENDVKVLFLEDVPAGSKIS